MIKNLRRSVAEGGKIKIGGLGEKKRTRDGQRTYRAPRKDDHFTITKTVRDENGDLVVDAAIMAELTRQGFADDHDGKIRTLPIMVHSDDIDQVFPTRFVCYQGKSVYCHGDGETATRIGADGKPAERACPCELLEPDDKGVRRCKYSGILHCSLRLPGHGVIGSVLKWRTTSQISCEQMVGHLETILYSVGVLRGLPLIMSVRPVQVNPQGQGARTVYVCHVDLAEQIAIAQRAALEAAQMRRDLAGGNLEALEQRYRATLQLPGSEDAAEQAEIADEYYPDEVVGSTPAGADVTAPAPITNPLDGLIPDNKPMTGAMCVQCNKPTYDKDLTDGVCSRCRPPAPPARPATPPPEPDPPKRTRRTRCKGCGEMKGPGIVKNGLCPDCREAQNQAPTAAPAAEPYERMREAAQAAARRGVTGEAMTTAISEAFPDYEERQAENRWSDHDADVIEGLLGGLEP